MIRSMTGFASAKGTLAPFSWSWELRSVNAKGLDLRLRTPDWLEGLDWTVEGIVTSPITGPQGNVEFLISARRA